MVVITHPHFFHGPLGDLDFPGKASAYNLGDPASVPGLGRSSGEGNGNPVLHSCLPNPMDRVAGGLWSMESQESDTT